MKKTGIILSMIFVVCLLISFGNKNLTTGHHFNNNDSLALERQRFTNEILKNIEDRKAERADSVFKNLKIFTGQSNIKAEHFLAVMNYWGVALGVSCTHCHNPKNWASDELNTKHIARGMYELRQTINRQISLSIKGLETVKPLVNCGTCHKGNSIPKD